ncbi:MAG: choice-of-anchor D domain-containing protein [Acidobacteriaceae bacterium]|nr:choice-of-anchor D domain-containing protein [Acidobacteriaceae bacterium]
MKGLLLGLVVCAGLQAQTSPLAFYLDSSGGQQPVSQLQSFPSSFSFPDTPVGGYSSVGVRVVNVSSAAVQLSALGFVNGGNQNNYFTGNLTYSLSLAPQESQFFTIYFVPTVTGATSASAQVGITGLGVVTFSTLSGNGTAAQLALSCSGGGIQRCDGSILQPEEQTAINFGSVATTSSLTVTFTLTNGGTSSIDPQKIVSIATATNNPSTGFVLGTVPSSIAAGASGTFTVTFSPGSTITQQATLLVGSSSFTLQGAGSANTLGDISSLVITYTDSTGVRLTAQPATSIDFGQIISGSGTNATLLFTVTNPPKTINAVSVPSISVSGAGFAISGTNPAPVTIQPNSSITFSVVFSGSATGTYTGTLSIGSRSFSLTAQSVTSSQPTPSITIDQNPLLSQQQAHVTVQLASAATVAEIGTLTMKFTPSVANVSDDPAIGFVAANLQRQLQVTVANGSQVGTYAGQSALTFQTGTTAGTLQFTVQFPNQAAVTQSFTIAPAVVAITQGTAQIQAPNLVLTLTGFDNTYSTGQLAFTFYGTNGQILTPTALSVDASSPFHTWFFTQSTVGGAFSLQASFPVTGDATQVGSVAVTLQNSVGQGSTTKSFH